MNAISKCLAIVILGSAAGVARAQFEGVSPDPRNAYLHEEPLSALGEFERVRANREFFEALRRGYQLSEEQFATTFRELRRDERAHRAQAREESDNSNAARNRARAATRDAQRAAEAFDLINAMRSGVMIRPIGLDIGCVAKLMDEAEALLLAREPLDAVDRRRLAAIASELRQAVHVQKFDDHDQRAEAMHVVVLLEYLAKNVALVRLASR